ncbi:hypothetical protein COCNU_scaffold070610G000010 [Cocos nucifera]|nr:hypothetical protein [Cocos nucifera]
MKRPYPRRDIADGSNGHLSAPPDTATRVAPAPQPSPHEGADLDIGIEDIWNLWGPLYGMANTSNAPVTDPYYASGEGSTNYNIQGFSNDDVRTADPNIIYGEASNNLSQGNLIRRGRNPDERPQACPPSKERRKLEIRDSLDGCTWTIEDPKLIEALETSILAPGQSTQESGQPYVESLNMATEDNRSTMPNQGDLYATEGNPSSTLGESSTDHSEIQKHSYPSHWL